jgi:hypothetical protein
VLEHPGHERQPDSSEPGTDIAGHGVLAVAAQGDVDVGAVALVIRERLRHEGREQAGALGDHLDDLLQQKRLIDRGHSGAVTQVDLELSGREFAMRRGRVETDVEQGGMGAPEQPVRVCARACGVGHSGFGRIRQPPAVLRPQEIELELDCDRRAVSDRLELGSCTA